MLTPRAHTQRTHNSTPRVAAAPTPSLLLRPRLVPTRSWRFPRCRSRKGAGLPPAPPLRGPRSTTSPRSRPGKLVEFDVRARCAVPASHPLRRALSTDPPMVVRPGSTQLSGFEVRFLVSGPAARGSAPAAAGCRPRAEHPHRQPGATVADANAAAPRRRHQLHRRRRRRRRRRPRRHRHRRHPTHRRHRRRRRSHYPRRRHRRRRSSRRRSRRRRRRRHRPCRRSRRRRPAPCPVPRTRTPRAHVTVAAAVAAGDDAASEEAEEADDAERPTPPMLPLIGSCRGAWTPTRRCRCRGRVGQV